MHFCIKNVHPDPKLIKLSHGNINTDAKACGKGFLYSKFFSD